jgi:hypothetical protein
LESFSLRKQPRDAPPPSPRKTRYCPHCGRSTGGGILCLCTSPKKRFRIRATYPKERHRRARTHGNRPVRVTRFEFVVSLGESPASASPCTRTPCWLMVYQPSSSSTTTFFLGSCFALAGSPCAKIGTRVKDRVWGLGFKGLDLGVWSWEF